MDINDTNTLKELARLGQTSAGKNLREFLQAWHAEITAQWEACRADRDATFLQGQASAVAALHKKLATDPAIFTAAPLGE